MLQKQLTTTPQSRLLFTLIVKRVCRIPHLLYLHFPDPRSTDPSCELDKKHRLYRKKIPFILCLDEYPSIVPVYCRSFLLFYLFPPPFVSGLPLFSKQTPNISSLSTHFDVVDGVFVSHPRLSGRENTEVEVEGTQESYTPQIPSRGARSDLYCSPNLRTSGRGLFPSFWTFQ